MRRLFKIAKKKKDEKLNEDLLGVIANLAKTVSVINERLSVLEREMLMFDDKKKAEEYENLIKNKDGLYSYEKLKARRAGTDGDND